MRRNDLDPYRILGVPPTATRAQITHAYRTRLRAEHPDTRRAPSSPTADERLRQVLAAYALIRDPARRADHDRTDTTPRRHGLRVETPRNRIHISPVQIPINHHHNSFTIEHPPLWAGPVRRHQ